MLKHILGFSKQKLLTKNDKFSDTIYALATGANSAVSIIRIGGPNAFRSLELLSKNHSSALNMQTRSELLTNNKLKQRMAHLRNIHNSSGNVIDQSLVLYFPPEHSYNLEEIIEFHVHGSKAVISSIFKELQKKGFRMAEGGEFTKRALLNGKINLMQAEAINDLIKSENEFERQIAMNNMLGKSEEFLKQIKDKIILCLANNEAYIDFQEDQSDVRSDLFLKNKPIVEQVLNSIDQIEKNYKNMQTLKEGINVTIFGKPNVGKSTLINSLSKKEIAIVSEEPGTTRDILHTQVECGGFAINLYDTAGLRDSENKVEMEGIRRAKLRMKDSHYKVLLIDLGQEEIREELNDGGKRCIEILYCDSSSGDNNLSNELIGNNTILIVSKADNIPLEDKEVTYFIKVHSKMGQESTEQKVYSDLVINCQSENESTRLLSLLQEKICQDYQVYTTSEQIYFTRERYFEKLRNCRESLEAYLEEERPDIACEYLRLGLQEISEMFGKVDVEEVLDVLFREFCVGK